MKKILITLAGVLFALSLTAVNAAAQKKTETVTFDTSITCDNCKKKVEENIPFEKGVKDLKVDVPAKRITVTFDPAKTDTEKIRQAIEKLGYKATVYNPQEPAEE